MEPQIQINNAVPTSTASVFDLNGSVVLEHGGVCTRLEFDKVESMSLDTFRKFELAKLRNESDVLHVIRNPSEDQYAFILGERVLRYKLTGCREVDLQDLLKELKFPDKTMTEVSPGLPWPLVAKISKMDGETITVSVPPTKRMYSCSTGVNFNLPYWCPPVWFSVKCNQAGGFRGGRIAIVKDFCTNYRDTTLFAWPLANAYRDGRICYGGANLSGISRASSDFDKIREAMSCFFDATFNADLLSGTSDQGEVLRGLCLGPNEYEEPYRTLLNNCSGSYADSIKYVIKVLWVLREPEGWRKLHYFRCVTPAIGFCGG